MTRPARFDLNGIQYVNGRVTVPMAGRSASVTVDTNDARLAVIGQGGAIPATVGSVEKAANGGYIIWYREYNPAYVNGAVDPNVTGDWSAIWNGPLYGIAPSSGAAIGVSLPAGKILQIGSWAPFALDRNVGSWPTGPLG